MLDGVKNFLQFINDNWISIIIIISLIITTVRKTKIYLSKSNDERIASAKLQIKEIILKLISDAEVDYEDWNKSGSIKRAQVIQEIFERYPILSKVTNQIEIIKWIDETINISLKELNEIVDVNKVDTSTIKNK